MENKNVEINVELANKMFEAIRNTEIKNVKTQKNDDKKMATILAKYIFEKVGGNWQ